MPMLAFISKRTPSVPQTSSTRISQSSDDVQVRYPESTLDTTWLVLGRRSLWDERSHLVTCFRSTGIPQGSVINSAKVYFTKRLYGGSGNDDVRIRVVDSGTPTMITSYGDYTSLSYVSNYSDWIYIGSVSTWTPDFSSAVQQAVDKPDFNGDIMVAFQSIGAFGASNQYLIPWDYNDSPGSALLLEVEYVG